MKIKVLYGIYSDLNVLKLSDVYTYTLWRHLLPHSLYELL